MIVRIEGITLCLSYFINDYTSFHYGCGVLYSNLEIFVKKTICCLDILILMMYFITMMD